MKKLLMILTCLLFFGSAHAQSEFRTPPSLADFQGGIFQCSIIRLKEERADADPVASIQVALRFNQNRITIDGMSIKLFTVFEQIFSRADQYSNVILTQPPGQLEAVWRGSWNKNPVVVMTGRLWFEPAGRHWYYSEYQEIYGVIRMRMLSGCIPASID